ncbi:amidohydrolase [Luteimicrobium subarcticum]|uniref:amidohydrolase n=1 Tax=Luteimicrobium subarcticum TaxID=620910 RepID=UPI000C24D9CC|nr:amidohydrolase family protein [Luteimicrobium subarcticum]
MTSILYRGGVVHSPADPFAEALLVDDGVVAWLGADDTAAGFASRADRVVDLDGALVTPAFVDSHVHVLETAFAGTGVDLSPTAGVRSLTEALDRLAGAAKRLDAASGEVLSAHGWDETRWPEGRRFTRDELDAACDGAPVYAARADVHSAVVTTTLAERFGLRSLDGWSEDGHVLRDAHHRARDAAREVSPARRTALYRAVLEEAARRGVVAVHEMSAPSLDTREGLAELVASTARADSGLPLVVGYRGELCADADDARHLLATVPGLAGIGGDLNVDGSFGSRTAALRSPYADDPARGTGSLYLTAEQICAHLVAVAAAGVGGGFHVIGDRAMDEFLLGLEIVAEVHGAAAVTGVRHRLEHALFVDARALAELLVFGISLSVQPAFVGAWGGDAGMYAERVGPLRAAALSPLADLVSAGVPVALGSDSPVTPLDPWGAVRAATNHPQVEQRVSARAAFNAHTRGGWRLSGHDGVGQLRVGAPAHLAVWRAEHLTVQAAPRGLSSWSAEARAGTPLLPDLSPDLEPPHCLQTVRDGVVLHDELG